MNSGNRLAGVNVGVGQGQEVRGEAERPDRRHYGVKKERGPGRREGGGAGGEGGRQKNGYKRRVASHGKKYEEKQNDKIVVAMA